jgi:hypothetical protein
MSEENKPVKVEMCRITGGLVINANGERWYDITVKAELGKAVSEQVVRVMSGLRDHHVYSLLVTPGKWKVSAELEKITVSGPVLVSTVSGQVAKQDFVFEVKADE